MSVFDRLLFRQDPNSVVREGEFLNMLDPNSVVREGEKSALMNLFADQLLDPNSVVREGEFLNMLDPNSVVREGEMMADPNSVVREGEMPTEQPIDSYTKALSDDEFRRFLITEIPNGENILEMLLQGNTPENFSALVPLLNQFTNYKATIETQNQIIPDNTFELDPAEQIFLDRLKTRAEGSPMEGEESDAVGIADGLDRETPPADPTSDGIAKVSPDQYVQLMNDIRGDDVPMEGRVQELAGVVGESDAQDTPLSVLALVQPVFELQEQQGIGATQQGQSMTQPIMQMANGGIVKRFNGSDEYGELGAQLGIDPEQMMGLANLFGVTQDPVNVQERSKELTEAYLDRANLPQKVKLMAAPYLLSLGSTILDPEAEIKDIAVQGAGSLAQFGTDVGKMKQPYEQLGLQLALEEKKEQKETQNKFIQSLGSKVIEDMFKEEKLIVDPFTNMLVSNVSGKPTADMAEEYNNQVLLKQKERMNENAKLTVVDDLLKLPNLTGQDMAQIRLDPNEWLKKNAEKAEGFLSDKDKKKIDVEGQMRDDFNRDSKNFRIRAESFNVIKGTVEDPSAAGDLSLIFSFMKLLDPNSTVRESEFANAENAGGVPTRIRARYNKVLSGQRLTKDQRNDFYKQTQNIYTSALEQQNKLINQTKEIANRYLDTYGVDWNNIIFDYTVPDATITPYPAEMDEDIFG